MVGKTTEFKENVIIRYVTREKMCYDTMHENMLLFCEKEKLCNKESYLI